MNEINDPAATLWQYLAGLVVGLPAIGLLLSRVLKTLRADRGDRISIDAGADVVTGMRAELDRLHRHNTDLVISFQAAQMAIIDIATKNQRLQVEIEQLRATIETMLRLHSKEA